MSAGIFGIYKTLHLQNTQRVQRKHRPVYTVN